MKLRLSILSVMVALAIVVQCHPAQARRGAHNVSSKGKFSFTLESDDRTLPIYNHDGYTFAEGITGQRYSIRVFNHTGERIEAVVTVDGRNVISGREGNYRNQRGYVIEAYDSVLIEGFRTSWSDVAAFRFAEIEESYAARMGNAANVGVIGVAVFKEKRRRPAPVFIPQHRSKNEYKTSMRSKKSTAPSLEMDSSMGLANEQSAPGNRGIGTAFGEEHYSPASETSFKRRRSHRPDARLAIYYDNRQGLIERGVLPRPRPHCPRPIAPQPFPKNTDTNFTPPPPPRNP